MTLSATCNQHKCENPAAYRFTWPGRDESVICEEHVGKLRGLAQAMGLYVQVLPLEPVDRTPTTPAPAGD